MGRFQQCLSGLLGLVGRGRGRRPRGPATSDALEIVRQVLEERARQLAGHGIARPEVSCSGTGDFACRVAPAELREAVNLVLSEAIAGVEGSSVRKISIGVAAGDGWITVRMVTTGRPQLSGADRSPQAGAAIGARIRRASEILAESGGEVAASPAEPGEGIQHAIRLRPAREASTAGSAPHV